MEEEFKQIIRLLEKDINGSLQTCHALTKVYGISHMFSNAVCSLAGIEKSKKIGSLSNEELKKIQSIVADPSEIPSWALNRKKDMATGKDIHLVGSDLRFNKETDIKHLRKIKCYRGVRHSLGLPVRGQRTRSNFRHGKTVGVKKKSIKSATGKK